MTVFDEALALERTVGKETWEPNPNLDDSQALAMARQKGLFQKVSKEMSAFPESLLYKQENDELWSIIKKDLRRM